MGNVTSMPLVPPSVVALWPSPNYDNPETRGPELIIVGSIFLALAALAVGLRLYTRIFVRHWIGLDDILVAISLVSVDYHKSILVAGSYPDTFDSFLGLCRRSHCMHLSRKHKVWLEQTSLGCTTIHDIT